MYFFEKFSNFSPTRRADFVQRPPAKKQIERLTVIPGSDYRTLHPEKNKPVLPPQKNKSVQFLKKTIQKKTHADKN